MERRHFCRLPVAALAAALIAATGTAGAQQDYPSRLVRLVIPFPPGGSAEAQARIIAQALSDDWKQPVVIENKPGGGTTIGAAFVAQSKPDGYTLYLAGTSHSISQSLYKNLPYHAVRSFAPVSLVAVSPFILTVHPGVAAKNAQELIALAKAKPGSLSYASSGSGAGPHLSAELFKSAAGIDAVHVPFKGSGPAMAALLGAQVDYTFADVAAIPMFTTGKLRALAVTTRQRSAFLPDVPTMMEAGLAYETSNWSALLAPAGTPREIVARINASVQVALRLPEVRQRFNAQGFEPVGMAPDALEAHLNAEVAKYAKAIADSGARVD